MKYSPIVSDRKIKKKENMILIEIAELKYFCTAI